MASTSSAKSLKRNPKPNRSQWKDTEPLVLYLEEMCNKFVKKNGKKEELLTAMRAMFDRLSQVKVEENKDEKFEMVQKVKKERKNEDKSKVKRSRDSDVKAVVEAILNNSVANYISKAIDEGRVSSLRTEFGALADSSVVLDQTVYDKAAAAYFDAISEMALHPENFHLNHADAILTLIRLVVTALAHSHNFVTASFEFRQSVAKKLDLLGNSKAFQDAPLNLLSVIVSLGIDSKGIVSKLSGGEGNFGHTWLTDDFAKSCLQKYADLKPDTRLKEHIKLLFAGSVLPPSAVPQEKLNVNVNSVVKEIVKDFKSSAAVFIGDVISCLEETLVSKEMISVKYFCRVWLSKHDSSFAESATKANLSVGTTIKDTTAAKFFKELDGKLFVTEQGRGFLVGLAGGVTSKSFQEALKL